MNKLAQIVISDEFQNPTDGQPAILINPAIGIFVPGIPTFFSFSITLLLTGYKNEKIDKFTMRIIDLSESKPEKRLLFHQEFNNAIPKEQFSNINSNLNFDMRNFKFSSEGTHRVEIKFNEETISQEFIVYVQKEN